MNKEETKRAGIYLYNQSNYQGALDLLTSGDLDPYKDTELALYLGLTYSKLHYTDSAIKLLDYVQRNDATLVLQKLQSSLALSYIYTTLHRYEEADQLLMLLDRHAIEQSPAYALWGYIAEQKNELLEALRRYKIALNIDPENTNALNSLGYLYTKLDKNLDEALLYCRRAVSLQPQNASYLHSLGVVCLKLNKLVEALDFFKRANTISPSDGVIIQHLKQTREAIERT